MTDDTWLRGDWMQTHTGRRFYPRDPRPEEVDPEDIAHALSLLCRYGGHVDRFYSVAEHCVLMSQAVAPDNAIYALLHDATEAYVCDVPRPLKKQLDGYQEIEARVWFAVAMRFHVELTLPAEVHEADNRILLNEREALFSRAEPWPSLDGLTPLPVTVTGWAPADAERHYLDRLEELMA
ncbi:MAG: phosphohydrolase [Salinibacterium sp.]|nr:MAG: phosphohydrolase [Salinibacterium sp.]